MRLLAPALCSHLSSQKGRGVLPVDANGYPGIQEPKRDVGGYMLYYDKNYE